MLTRRSLAAAAAAAAAVLATPMLRPARAATRTLRLGTTLPVDSNVGAPLQYFAQQAAARTEGRVKVELMWNSSIGGESEMVEGVRNSTLDCGLVAISPLGALVPEAALLDMPFVFRDSAHAFSVVDGPIGAEIAEKLAAQHVNILGWADNGIRHITANRAIRDASALAGVKIRVAGSDLMIQAFNAMGAVASTVPWGRLYQELRSGRYEAQENAVPNIIAGKLQEVQSFIMLTAHVYSASVIIASDDVMDDLSPADRPAVISAAREAGRMTRAESVTRTASGLAAIRAQGVTVIETVDRASFVRALAPAVPEISAKYGSATLERIRSYTA